MVTKEVDILVTSECGSGWATQHTPGTPNWKHVLTYQPIIDFVKRKSTSERTLRKLVAEMIASAPDKHNWYMFLRITPSSLTVMSVHDDGVIVVEIEGYERVYTKKI